MKLAIKKLSDEAIIPTRAHTDDAGLDLYADGEYGIPVLGRRLVGTSIAVSIPAGHVGYITPRSGLANNHGISVLNAPGTVDSGYTGEVKVNLVNHGQAPYMIRRGERIAQLVLHKVELPDLVEVDELETTTRGHAGHGSTGK